MSDLQADCSKASPTTPQVELHNQTPTGGLMTINNDAIDDFFAHIGVSTAAKSIDLVSHPSSGGSGSGSFDEAKVKRDNNGKFSKNAAADAKDAEWLQKKKINELAKQVLANNFAEIGHILDEVAKQHGFAPEDYKDHLDAADEAITKSVDFLNSDVVNAIGLTSPSKKQRVFYVANKEKHQIDWKVEQVRPGAVVHADSDAIDAVLRSVVEVSEDDAEQHGVKGMKWGVRRPVSSSTGLVSKGNVGVKVSNSGKVKVKGGGFGLSPFLQRRAVRKALDRGVVKPDPKQLHEEAQSHGIGGGRVRGGLKPRTGSADQIGQDRIAKKLANDGPGSLSNKDIQDYTRRLQLKQDLDRAVATQTAAANAKSDGFIKAFAKKQGDRQLNRLVNAAADIAVEQGLAKAGIKLTGVPISQLGKKGGPTSKSELGDNLQRLSTRIVPKKK